MWRDQFDAMVFDCDGVLVDSEPIVNQVLRDDVAALGWEMTVSECVQTFVGASLEGVRERIEQHLGRPVGDVWVVEFVQHRDDALRAGLRPVPGAAGLVAAAEEAFEGRIACASNSDRAKIELQLDKTGLLAPFQGRIFSAAETGPEKPSPAVYLAAASSFEPPSSRPLVLEDSPSGVRAGKAAGGWVIGLAATVSADGLKEAGADVVVTSLSEVAGLLEAESPR
ncbi:HAD family hydrolase [Nesterenkonia flava]|uniref:HAD family phosphatase n=1 Tax=Nesterenkonia flava TaxID=469799 RepID=A0ABU1FQR8_9MICC|nr:HAD family phosphatase [Nesterenkonia flava]MDR5710997.1 HAD family phosphatase [Nesterenkonia flava]